MDVKIVLVIFFLVFPLYTEASSTNDCLDLWNAAHINKTVRFSIVSKKNKTGHWITNFSLVNAAKQLPKNWGADIHHKVIKDGGIEVFQLEGKLIIPPGLPKDYQLYRGVGYYKYHSNKLNFDAANNKCAEEGGHLAIINSEAEHQVIRSLVKNDSAYLGFHYREKEGEFITIFGEPLAATGFTGWIEGQPDNSGNREHCGSYYPKYGLNDLACENEMPFICEYDLSWSE